VLHERALQPQLTANGVTDLAGNTGPASAAAATTTLTLDRVAPTVSSITPSVALTNAASATFNVTLSESVTGVAAGNFTLVTSGLSASSITSVTGSAASWTVSVATGSGNGTIRLDLSSTSPTIADGASNSLAATFNTGSVLTVDRVSPTVSAFTSAVASPTNSTSIAYSLTFSEDVSGVAAGDFTNAGTATGCTFAPSASTASGGTPITVTVTTCSTTGNLQPELAANGVTDTAGNTGPATGSATTTLTLDRVVPTVSSIAPSALLMNAASATFTVTFSEAVTGLDATDIDITTGGGTATGCTVDAPAGSGTTWTVTLSGCSTGTVTFGLKAGAVEDQAGNPGPATQVDAATVTVIHDTTAPTFTKAIRVVLRSGVSLRSASTTSAIPVLITWAAADDATGSGLDHYKLEVSLNGGLPTVVALPTSLTTSFSTTMPTSGTVAYRVTACDVMNNCTTPSSTGTLSPRIIQQSSTLVKYSGTWYLYKAASLSGTTLKWSRTKNAYATYTFTGRGIGFVAIKGLGRGYVKIYLDGKYRGHISLYKTGASLGRLLAWQSGALTSGKHTIKLIVEGTFGHPRVDLDAFAVLK